MVTAAIAGASGYAGGEVLRLLAGHPTIRPTVVAAGARAGELVGAIHPNLMSFAAERMVPTDPATLAEADIVFLALPHGESAALVAQLPEDQLVVDLGADFRLRDADQWRRYYGGSFAGSWAYGLPEMPEQRVVIAGSRRVANPGCYATSVALALAPILRANLGKADDVVVVAASGTSGAGRKPSDALLATQVMGSMSAYKAGGVHQHIPEIEQTLADACGQPVRMSFTPLLAPMPRGIVSTCTVSTANGSTAQQVRECLIDAYARELFVHVLPEGVWPQSSSVAGTNAAHLQVAFDEHAGRIVVVCAIDNLGKGAAGQAMQNANLMLGFDEAAGLTSNGIAP